MIAHSGSWPIASVDAVPVHVGSKGQTGSLQRSPVRRLVAHRYR